MPNLCPSRERERQKEKKRERERERMSERKSEKKLTTNNKDNNSFRTDMSSWTNNFARIDFAFIINGTWWVAMAPVGLIFCRNSAKSPSIVFIYLPTLFRTIFYLKHVRET